MNKMQYQVFEFHEKFGVPSSDIGKPLPENRKKLRYKLIKEELKELKKALKNDDLVETIDACIDILYVTYGLLNEINIDAEPFFDEVHESNMSKLGEDGKPIYSRGMELDGYPEGKVLKGPNYFTPRLDRILEHELEHDRAWRENGHDIPPEEYMPVDLNDELEMRE